MPHTFKAHPKHPAVPFLIRLHADIGGRILENKRQAERLAADAKAVEAVLKMFDPDFNARAISARRRVTGNPWFKGGTLLRAALEALRTAHARRMGLEGIVSNDAPYRSGRSGDWIKSKNPDSPAMQRFRGAGFDPNLTLAACASRLAPTRRRRLG
jgi:hypothetical protein